MRVRSRFARSGMRAGIRGRQSSGLLASLGLVILLAAPAGSLELRTGAMGEERLALRGSLKWTTFLSHAPHDTLLYPERWSAAALFRARLNVEARPTSWMYTELAYEQRARTASEESGAGAGAGILPPNIPVAYRLSPIDAPLVEIGSSFAYRHELDRCFVSLRAGRGELTIGRQAIGWGRGVLFSAVDIFAPFTPLESDREWRRGIDAVRGRLFLSSHVAVDLIAALGDSVAASAFVGRVHGRVGDLDGELIAGRRREDEFYACAASAPVLDAELHGEFALYRMRGDVAGGGVFGRDDLAVKAVVGGSYSLDLPFGLPGGLPAGLIVVGEYHYSGFGLPDVTDLELWANDPDFVARLAQGDSQILGRQAGALQLTYGFASVTPVSLAWIFSPTDGSGVLIPALTYIFSDHVTLGASGYLSYGAAPGEGVPQSEYGGTPASGLVQIGFYF